MNSRILKLAQVSAVAAAIALCAGCKRNATAVAPSGGTGPGGSIVSAEKTSFDEVTSKLDKGGNLYLYLSTEQVMARMATNLAAFSNMFTQLPNVPQENVTKIFEVIGNLVKESGIEHISGVGASSIAREPNFYYNKFIVHHYTGENDGLLWTMFGNESHPLKELDLLPEDTAFASYMDLDVPLVWKTIQKELKQAHNPQIDQGLAQIPDKFKASMGISLDDVMASLGGGYGFVFTLDEKTMVGLPIPGNAMEIPSPGLAIFFKVKNDAIYNRIDQLTIGNPLVAKSTEGGIRTISIVPPIQLSFPLRPTFARSGDYLFITSSDTMLRTMLAVQAGKEKGYKSTDEFKRLSQGVPAEGNNFTIVSEKFGRSMKQVVKTMISAQPAALGNRSKSIQDMMDANPAAITYAVGANGPEGWEAYGNGNQSMGAVILPAMIGGTAIGAAIALPAIAKAKAAAQGTAAGPQANACINNLRLIDGAKGQWALENHKQNTDVPTVQDLTPYLGRGPNGQFPVCPEGGIYTIGAINERPRCSIPGHQLP
jgi:hypothetical protein